MTVINTKIKTYLLSEDTTQEVREKFLKALLEKLQRFEMKYIKEEPLWYRKHINEWFCDKNGHLWTFEMETITNHTLKLVIHSLKDQEFRDIFVAANDIKSAHLIHGKPKYIKELEEAKQMAKAYNILTESEHYIIND